MVFDLQHELIIALQAVQAASLLVKKIQQEIIVDAIDKEDNSPVTVADFASQAVISHILRRSLGDICLVGEENSTALHAESAIDNLWLITQYVNTLFPEANSSEVCDWIDFGNAEPSESFWTVDPIDGTKGFLRGDQYAIALAYVENGDVKIGVLGCPNLTHATTPDAFGKGSIIYAARGQGCYYLSLDHIDDLNEAKKLTISTRDQFSQVLLLRSYESGHTNADMIGDLAASLGIQHDPIRMDSQAKYALLASGAGDVILRLLSPKRLDYKEKIWDQAAGAIILEEAGGKITDLSGKPLDFTQGRTLRENRGILATNGLIHDQLIAALMEMGQ